MIKVIKRCVPLSLKKNLERLYEKFKYFGLARYCSVCNSWVRNFITFGLKQRTDAKCPICKALERHRFVWLFFKKETNLFDGKTKKMLHFAPERELERNFKKVPGLNYLSADLNDPNAMVKMDITNIEYSDESFDLIYCGHVLEHVEDDRKAISELYRVLKKNGQAVILVPIMVEKTFEDPTITDPAERERAFGQSDHVRKYGPDFKNRLTENKFETTIIYISEYFNEKDIERLGLKYIDPKEMPIFFCKKRG
jgi:SAM-dependent methyltransferase